MANDGQIVFEVTADGKHAIADIKEITRVIQQETGKWDTAAKQSTDSIENKFSGMLKKLAAGFSAVKIGKALLDLGKQALDAASDLEEVQNVVDVTFGDNANKIEEWAKAAGTQFGLTETKAKQFSSTMGAMLKSSGLAGEQIVDVSTDLAGLAADMASFYNLDFDEAFAKIRSGISGQTMPLKELGIDMSVATLNAFALQQGLSKTFNQMSQSEQVMLRYQYLMSATADAQGDFARTSDGYANSMRTLESNIDRLKATLGKSFIEVVANATTNINKFIDKLYPDESKKSVLEKLNDIEIDTQEKLANIQKVADQANGLIDKLNVISGTDAGTALENMAIGANKLDSTSPVTWNALLKTLKTVDGLDNVFDANSGTGISNLASALSGAELDTSKAEAWKTFLAALSENADAVSTLTGTSAEETKAWLDGIAASVDNINPDDVDAWDKLLTSLAVGFSGGTPEGQKFVEGLASQFLALGSDSIVAVKGLESLGFSSEQITDKQEEWLKTCKELVKTIPGLSTIIDTETGAVTGGVGALEDYVDEWKTTQEKLLRWKAYYAKQAAQEEANMQIYGLEVAAGGAQKAIERQKKKLDELRKTLGVGNDGYEMIIKTNATGGQGVLTQAEQEWNNAVVELGKKRKEAKEAENEYTQAVKDNAEAIQKNKDEHDYLVEKYGEVEQETKAVAKAMTTLEKAAAGDETAIKTVTDAVNGANEALKEMADYAESVHDSVSKSVDSVVSGFGKIETPMDKNRKKVEDLQKEIDGLDKKAKDYKDTKDKLDKTLVSTQGDQISAQNMGKNLEQQAQYMENYLKYLREARNRGISNEVLAALSDGSTESYDYLEQLAKASDPEVKTINDNYQKVIDKKKELSDELSKQQLTVDKTYESLVEKAKQAITELNLESDAKDNAGKTVQAVAEGISSGYSEVKEAVDAIVAEVNRLAGLGISVSYDGTGSVEIRTSTPHAEASAAGGMDFVPRDMYARIHEGETILKAEEASLYRELKYGNVSGVDMDTLGGVMRDNVKGGGNVYLDGKIVGNVISDRQGRSYKAMQRSGWQA